MKKILSIILVLVLMTNGVFANTSTLDANNKTIITTDNSMLRVA